MAISSPCNSVCRMNSETQYCEGCYRTLDEIVAWGSADDARKVEIWREVIRRKAIFEDEPAAGHAGSVQ